MSVNPNSGSPRRRSRSLENKAAKLINAWLIYLDLAALVNAKVEVGEDENPNIWDKGVAIVGNSLRLEEGLFKQLKAEAAKARENNNAFKIAVAFPKIYKVEDSQRQFQPLFTINISSIFDGNFRKTGWDLTEQFEFQPILPNLIDVAEIDEERTEQLVTREGLHTFLEDTFKHSFKTLQDFLNLLVLPDVLRTVQSVPYLLRFDFVSYTHNLKKDLKKILEKILDQQQYWDWVCPGHPAFEYLFGQPDPPDHAIWYAGAFPIHAPTDSQAQVFKHLQCNPLTAVVGPPGCGKTISLSHGVAMLVSDRALHLIESGQDESNLTLVTSTNNRAVKNVEDLLAEDPTLSFLFLPGGSKDVIRDRSLPQLQKAMLWLEETPFNESEQQATADVLLQKVNQLQTELAQDQSNQEERQNITRNLEAVEQQITSLQASLAALNLGDGASNPFGDYSQFPLVAYQQIESLLTAARNSEFSAGATPSTPSNWWQRLYQPLKRLWQWLIQRRQRTHRADFYDRINRLTTQVQATPFPLQFQLPLNDQMLREKQTYVSTQIKAAQAWQTVDRITANLNQQTNHHSQLERQLAAYPERDFYSRFYTEELHGLQQEVFQLSQRYLRQEALRRKNEVSRSLELYARILEGSDQDGLAYRRLAREWRTVYRDFSLLFPVLTSTLNSIRNLLPFPDTGSLAYVFADEAGTTSIHQLFPALVRCQKALVVGDPLQLQPIVPFSKHLLDQYYKSAFSQQELTEDDFDLYSPTSYETASAYQRASGADNQPYSKGYGIILTEHFRCPEPIATLVDRLGGYGLSIKSTPVVPILGSHLIASHVEGSHQNKANLQEIDAVIAWVEHLYALGYSFGSVDKKKTIAVLSPYRKQANALRRALQPRWRDCSEENTNTNHAFQGGAKAIVILSTRQCHPTDSLLFLNRGPNLINVAVSRTTESLILVGNTERLREGIYSRVLVEHIRQYGEFRSIPDSKHRR